MCAEWLSWLQIAVVSIAAAVVWGPRYITLLAGSLVDFVLALLLFIASFVSFGRAGPVREFVAQRWDLIQLYVDEPFAHQGWSQYAENARADFLVWRCVLRLFRFVRQCYVPATLSAFVWLPRLASRSLQVTGYLSLILACLYTLAGIVYWRFAWYRFFEMPIPGRPRLVGSPRSYLPGEGPLDHEHRLPRRMEFGRQRESGSIRGMELATTPQDEEDEDGSITDGSSKAGTSVDESIGSIDRRQPRRVAQSVVTESDASTASYQSHGYSTGAYGSESDLSSSGELACCH